jgi:hypothetical protein
MHMLLRVHIVNTLTTRMDDDDDACVPRVLLRCLSQRELNGLCPSLLRFQRWKAVLPSDR